jgi:O-antigen/teichoic acid export membrane protein
LFYILTPSFGLIGPGIAASIGGVLTFWRMLVLVRKLR